MSKIIRFIRFVRNSLKKRDFPPIINYDITSKCNLNCEHCYWRKNLPKKELSDEQWKKTFQEFREKGAGAAFLTGGEPALRPNVLRMAYEIFDSMTIVSNGTIKIPEDIQCRIFISIDGPEKVHNKIRGAKVFDKIIKNIKNDKRVVITPTLSTTNYRYIQELVDITRESNVDGITFSLYASHKKSNDSLLLTGDKLDWTINKLLGIQQKNKDILWMTPFMIKSWKTKEYFKECYMRNKKNVISFDAEMNKKEPCVMGKGVNCGTCGCIIPVMSYALKKRDIGAWFLFDKFYPERYYKQP